MKVLSHKKGLAKYHIVNQSGFSMEYQPRVCCPCRCLWPQKPRYGKARDLRGGRGTDKSVGFDGSNFGVSRCELAAGHDDLMSWSRIFVLEEHGDLDILIGLAEDFPGQDFLKLCVFWAAFSDLGCFGVMKLGAKVPCPLPSQGCCFVFFSARSWSQSVTQGCRSLMRLQWKFFHPHL